MYLTEIFYKGEDLDLYEDKGLNYTIQVNDIGEIKDRQASYTNSYEVPKTPKNIRLLGGLALPSDTSVTPYTQDNCQVKIEGFDFIVKGWLNVKDTDDNFKIYIYSGIVGFFKAIENKTLGKDLDLSEINHTKNVAAVVNSFTSNAYRYLITDYNGLTHYGTSGEKINIDYLVPSVNVRYLWDKIHNKFGFNYTGSTFSNSYFNNLWILYPKGLGSDSPLTSIHSVDFTYFIEYTTIATQNYIFPASTFTVPERGFYRVRLKGDFRSGFGELPFGSSFDLRVFINDVSNFVSIKNLYGLSLPQDVDEYIVTLELNAGDVISVGFNWISNSLMRLHVDEGKFEVYQVSESQVSFIDELADYNITDFVKEILNFFALTPYTDEHSNTIDYLNLYERVVSAPTEDWSDKYIERESESYVFQDYAQRNIFSYQYNDKNSSYHDGALVINNINLKDKKTVFSSKHYSPERDLTQFYLGSVGYRFMRIFKLYEKEIKEDGGVQTIKYKGLSKRFHYAKSIKIDTSVIIGSETLNQEATVTSLPIADFSDLSWQQIINTNYYQFGRILNDSRMHKMTLHVNPADIMVLDLKKLYYFEQEQQYYFFNSVQYAGDNTAKVEAIRVKREDDGSAIPPDPTDPDIDIAIVWTDTNDNLDITGSETTKSVKIATLSYPVDEQIVSYGWQINTGSGYVNVGSGGSPYLAALSSVIGATTNIRLAGVSESGVTYYSNVLNYTLEAACVCYHAWKYGNSGDDVTIWYTDCDGVEQEETVYTAGGLSTYLEVYVHAQEGSATTNGNLDLC